MIVKPTWLGQPMYPGGFPLPPENVHVEGRSIQDIYLKGISIEDTKVTRTWTADEVETLKSYCAYYVKAPVFSSEFTDELVAMDFMKMTLDDVIMECLNYGLDPF